MDFNYSDSDDSSQSSNDVIDFGYRRAHADDASSSLPSNDSSDDEFLNDNDDDEKCNGSMDMTEDELKKLTNNQLKEKLRALGLKVSGKKQELVDRLLNPNSHRKPVAWKKSKAKALLNKLLHDRDSRLHNMTTREIYETNDWFQEYPFDRFNENVTSLRKTIQENFTIVDRDIEIVREELRNFPQSSEGSRGYPRWDKHPARSLLRRDIQDGKYVLGQAKKFQKTRQEYGAFPLAVFRDHIHQERRRQREKPMKVIQRNKKAQKLHQKEVEEREELWIADEKYRKEMEEIISAMENF
eukprot:scaffold18880_cov68-Skeletonema_menzelii.AAC.2